jgi:DNA-binding protein HU-beta
MRLSRGFRLAVGVLVTLWCRETDAFVARGARGVTRPNAVPPTLLHAATKKTTPKKTTKKTAPVATPVTPETFKKADFVTALAEQTGQTKKESEGTLQAVLDILQAQVSEGKKVTLPGFGSFVLKSRAARKGRNPQTGEEMQIAASKSPGFTPSKAWKDMVNGK